MDMCFFFFKQKTAYEMRISDWSSDVCSSDLGERARAGPHGGGEPAAAAGAAGDLVAAAAERRGGALRHQADRREGAVPAGRRVRCRKLLQIGRASCRERVGQSV